MLIDFDVKRLTTNVLNFVRVTTINLNKPEIFGASVVFPHSKDNRVMLLMAGKKQFKLCTENAKVIQKSFRKSRWRFYKETESLIHGNDQTKKQILKVNCLEAATPCQVNFSANDLYLVKFSNHSSKLYYLLDAFIQDNKSSWTKTGLPFIYNWVSAVVSSDKYSAALRLSLHSQNGIIKLARSSLRILQLETYITI